jgi:hypothetical protein
MSISPRGMQKLMEINHGGLVLGDKRDGQGE